MTEKTKKILELRKAGKSYNQIQKELGVSQGNISYVCRKYFEDNNRVIKNLILKNPNTFNNKKAREKALQVNKKRHAKEKDEKINKWALLLKNVDEIKLATIAGMFECDGGHGATTKEFMFYNSDARLILTFVDFLNDINCDFYAYLVVHPTQNAEKAKSYWEKLGIRIRSIQTIKTTKKQKKDNSERIYHGTIRLYVRRSTGLKEAFRSVTAKFFINTNKVSPLPVHPAKDRR